MYGAIEDGTPLDGYLNRTYVGPEEEIMALVQSELNQKLRSRQSKVIYVDHPVTQNWGYNENAWAIIYDPNKEKAWIGPMDSSHAELINAIPEIDFTYGKGNNFPENLGY